MLLSHVQRTSNRPSLKERRRTAIALRSVARRLGARVELQNCGVKTYHKTKNQEKKSTRADLSGHRASNHDVWYLKENFSMNSMHF